MGNYDQMIFKGPVTKGPLSHKRYLPFLDVPATF